MYCIVRQIADAYSEMYVNRNNFQEYILICIICLTNVELMWYAMQIAIWYKERIVHITITESVKYL